MYFCVSVDDVEVHSSLRKLRPSAPVPRSVADCRIPTSGSKVHYHQLSADRCRHESRMRERVDKEEEGDGERR